MQGVTSVANITVHPEVTHRLDDHCCGVNMGVYYNWDMDNQFYRDLFADSGFEIFRAFTDGYPLTYKFYPSARAFAEHMQDRLGDRFALMLGTPIMPNPQPATTTNPMPAISTVAGFSLTDQRAFYRSCIQLGINVMGWQFTNEAHLKTKDHEGNALGPGTPWFYSSGSVIVDQPIGIRQMANDFITYVNRDVYAAYRAEIDALEQDTKVLVPAEANMGSNQWGGGYGLLRAFLLGEMLRGTPSRGPNIPHMDIFTVHNYPDGGWSGIQEQINTRFYDGGETEAQHRAEPAAKGGLKRPLRLLRELLNANGGSHIRIGIDEGGNDRVGARGSLKNVLEAIAFCQIPGMAYLITHPFCRAPAGYETLLGATNLSPDPFTSASDLKPSPRFFAARDVWVKFMRESKDQLRVTITGSGKTPGVNSIDNIQAVAGKSGTKTRLMVANANITVSETVNWNLGESFTLGPGEFRLVEFVAPTPPPPPPDECEEQLVAMTVERDEALAGWDQAVNERDTARAERDTAIGERFEAQMESMRLNGIIDAAQAALADA